MPYRFYLDAKVNCIFIQHFDEFQQNDGINVTNEVLGNPEYRMGMNILRDATQTPLPKRFSDNSYLYESRRQAEKMDLLLGTCRLAWIVGSAKDFGAVHRWSVSTRLSKSVERHPFRELSKALEWLGIPAEYEIRFPNQVF